MRFTSAFLVSAAAALANAQAYFTMNTLPGTIAPGTNYDISWLNGQGTSTVTIFLVQGTAQSLTTVMSIASGQPHNGTLSWTPSASLASASNYAFKIVDDSNANDYNYSGMFAIATSITASTNTQSISSTAPATSMSATGLTSSATGSTTRASSGSAASTASSAVSSFSRAASATSANSATGTNVPSASTTVRTNSARNLKASGGLLAAIAGVMVFL